MKLEIVNGEVRILKAIGPDKKKIPLPRSDVSSVPSAETVKLKLEKPVEKKRPEASPSKPAVPRSAEKKDDDGGMFGGSLMSQINFDDFVDEEAEQPAGAKDLGTASKPAASVPIDFEAVEDPEEEGASAKPSVSAKNGERIKSGPKPSAPAATVKPKVDLTPVECSPKVEAQLWDLIVLEAEKQEAGRTERGTSKDKGGDGWALSLLKSVSGVKTEFVCDPKDVPRPSPSELKLSKRVQVVLHPDNTQARKLAFKLIQFFSDTVEGGSTIGALFSAQAKLRKAVRPFAEAVLDKFGRQSEGESVAGFGKTLTVDQILTRLQSNSNVVVDSALGNVHAVVQGAMRQMPKDPAKRAALRSDLAKALELAGKAAESRITDREQKKSFMDKNSSLAVRSQRDKGDYGHEVRKAQADKLDKNG